VLEDFMRLIRRRPYCLGELDCALSVADWWLIRTGVDPAARFRGTYATHEDVANLFRHEGVFPRLVARLAKEVGAVRTFDPEPGDVAIVRAGAGWWGAIMSPTGRWTIKTERGVAVSSEFRVIRAWTVA
jgi:hypothetical protein